MLPNHCKVNVPIYVLTQNIYTLPAIFSFSKSNVFLYQFAGYELVLMYYLAFSDY